MVVTMKQVSFGANEYGVKPKRTRREKFLEEMEAVVPWSRLIVVVEPHYLEAGMEEARHEVPLLRRFAGLDVRWTRYRMRALCCTFAIFWRNMN